MGKSDSDGFTGLYQDKVSHRELELLKLATVWVDWTGTEWDWELSEAEKASIQAAPDRFQLAEIQQKIRQFQTAWNNFFTAHRINQPATKTWWKNTYPGESGFEQAEQVYTAELAQFSPEQNWERELTDPQKGRINLAPTPAQIKKVKGEINWEIFFAERGIENEPEKNAWQKATGLTVGEARIAFDQKKWRNLSDTATFPKIKNKKVTYNPELSPGRLSAKEVSLLNRDQEEMKKMLKLWWQIDTAPDLTTLRQPTIKNIPAVYQADQTNFSWEKMEEHWKEKELGLFITAFEADGPSSLHQDRSLNKDQKLARLQAWLAKTNGNGPAERKWQDNGWSPEEIEPSLLVPGGWSVEFPNIIDPHHSVVVIIQSINPAEVKKPPLELVKELLADINGKAQASDLHPYSRINEIEALTDQYLPVGWKEADIKGFLTNRWEALDRTEFVAQVKDKHPTVPLTEPQIYRFRTRQAPSRERHLLSPDWVAATLASGWTNPEEIHVRTEAGGAATAYAKVGSWEFDPRIESRAEVRKKEWIADFVRARPGLSRPLPTKTTPDGPEIDQDQVLAYRAGEFTNPGQAREVYENGWAADQFTWKNFNSVAEIASYTSHGETDTNLDGSKISRFELDKVNMRIKFINQSNLSVIIHQSEITKYDQNKVPDDKKHVQIEKLYTAKLNQLEQARRATQIKAAIAQIESELNQKPVISASKLTNSDYSAQLANLINQGTEPASYQQKVIAEIKQKRTDWLASVRQTLATAETILASANPTKSQLEQAINNLKTIAAAPTDSAESLIWSQKTTQNQKLLTDLESKLSQIAPPSDKTLLPPPPTPNQPLTPQQQEVYGADWAVLQPVQRERRQEVVQKWQVAKAGVQRKSCCSTCQKPFVWDKSLNYSAAKKKVLADIQNCQKVCASSPNPVQKVTQQEWEQERKTKFRNIYSCPHCWGKIVWDKKIAQVETAQEQAVADWNYHQKEECHKPENQRKVAIYFSPNRGGNQHAPLSYSSGVNWSSLVLEKDDQGQIWQEQVNSNHRPNNWTPGLIGQGIFLVAGILLLAGLLLIDWKRRTSRKNPQEK